jgi:hypothetical protein
LAKIVWSSISSVTDSETLAQICRLCNSIPSLLALLLETAQSLLVNVSALVNHPLN